MYCLKLKRFCSLPFPQTHEFTSLPNPLPHPVHQLLRHPPVLILPSSRPGHVFTGGILRSHTRQHILTGTQTNEQREGDEPHTETEIRRYLRKSRHLIRTGEVTTPPAPRRRGRQRRLREVPEPQPVVEQHEDAGEDEEGV